MDDDQKAPRDNEGQAQQPGPGSPQVSPSANPSWSEVLGPPGGNDSKSGHKRPLIAAGAVLLLFVIAAVAVLMHHGGHSTSYDIASHVRNSGPDSGQIQPAKAASADTPLGETAYGSGGADGLAISIAGVVRDPHTVGQPADKGMRYIEIDLNVGNSTAQSMIVPGSFYYQTGSGKLLSTATSTGPKPAYANKQVQVAGKESLDALSLDAGQSDDSHYLIFQIPASDHGGKLIWYEGYYDTRSTKLAIFDLQ